MICRVCTNAADIPVTNRIEDTLIMSAIRTVANISVSTYHTNGTYRLYYCNAQISLFQYNVFLTAPENGIKSMNYCLVTIDA